LQERKNAFIMISKGENGVRHCKKGKLMCLELGLVIANGEAVTGPMGDFFR
jgi:hypothetical protein